MKCCRSNADAIRLIRRIRAIRFQGSCCRLADRRSAVVTTIREITPPVQPSDLGAGHGSAGRGTRTSDYDFHLPPHLIAQHPVTPRDASRLMVVDRMTGTISHRTFSDLASLIPAGDVLAVNSSRVVRARLLGHRDSGAPAEVFLLRPLGDDRFEAMVHPGGKLRPGRRVHIADGLDVEILEITDRRTRIVKLVSPLPVADAIERFGHVPLPPYIDRG